jgi:hypothetical protein
MISLRSKKQCSLLTFLVVIWWTIITLSALWYFDPLVHKNVLTNNSQETKEELRSKIDDLQRQLKSIEAEKQHLESRLSSGSRQALV